MKYCTRWLIYLTLWLPSLAWAGAQGRGGQLAIERPLQVLSEALTGTVAYYVGVVAIASGGALLAFGADIDKALQRLAWALMAVGIAVNSAQILNVVFASTI